MEVVGSSPIDPTTDCSFQDCSFLFLIPEKIKQFYLDFYPCIWYNSIIILGRSTLQLPQPFWFLPQTIIKRWCKMPFSLIISNPVSNLEILIRVFVALVIGSVVGVEREYKNRPAGLRTHVLVCLGSCTIALIETMFSAQLSMGADSHINYSFGRLCAQVISGIGFLGAGTIFTSNNKKISGLTTAASLWNTACLGLAAGYGYYWIALLGCIMVMMTLMVLQKVIPVNSSKRVEVRFIHRNETIAFINSVFEKNNIEVMDLDFHVDRTGDPESNDPNVYTNIYTLHLPNAMNYADLINTLSAFHNIQLVRTTNT